MLDKCIYNLLEYIYSRGNDLLRLEYLSACKLMGNENCILNSLQHIPASLFEPLLQAAIHKCYLEFQGSNESDIIFPETIVILILNWPHKELILRNHLPPLYKPDEPLFAFCNILIQFITKAVLKCTPIYTHGFSSNLMRLDVSGLDGFDDYWFDYSDDFFLSFSTPEDILVGISNSKFDTFGHTIEIIADAKFREKKGFEILRNIIVKSLNTNFGLSVYFKKITARFLESSNADYPSDFYDILVIGRCEYLNLECRYKDQTAPFHFDSFNDMLIKQSSISHPYLKGIGLSDIYDSSENYMEFISSFRKLEQFSLSHSSCNESLTNYLCNMSNGLKFLDLTCCFLINKDLECLAKSIHSNTLLQLDLSSNNDIVNDSVDLSGNNHYNDIVNDSESLGLIMLCQKLKNVKVLTIDDCSLDTMSSNSVSKLANAINDCIHLQCLSMRNNNLCLEKTKIIVDGIDQIKSLKYLGLEHEKRIIRNVEI